MSSVEYLREFINERLTVAAEEIFGVFVKNIVEYQEEIDRQRRLLDIVWQPAIKLHRIELPQQHVCKEEEEDEEEVLSEQQLCIQERSSSLDREDPEPPQIKEEQEELCTSQEGEQLEMKQETETFMLTPTCEEMDHSEDETLNLCTDETQRVAQETPLGYISVESAAVPEPNKDHEAERQDQKGGKHGDSESTKNAEPKLKPYLCNTCGKRFKRTSTLNTHMRTHTGEGPYSCITCGMIFSQLSTLIPHIKSHMGEKPPYLCNTCGKRFSSTSTLKAHKRVHTGEKPFSCNTCGERFSWTSQLKAHKRVHTGEKS